MSVIHIGTTESDPATRRLVQSAIEAEVNRLQLALSVAQQRLAPFEQRYRVTSAHFITNMSAEDLDGGDDEYVQWAGEYELSERLREKLQRLQGIQIR